MLWVLLAIRSATLKTLHRLSKFGHISRTTRFFGFGSFGGPTCFHLFVPNSRSIFKKPHLPLPSLNPLIPRSSPFLLQNLQFLVFFPPPKIFPQIFSKIFSPLSLIFSLRQRETLALLKSTISNSPQLLPFLSIRLSFVDPNYCDLLQFERRSVDERW